jgi:hypothetical protein
MSSKAKPHQVILVGFFAFYGIYPPTDNAPDFGNGLATAAASVNLHVNGPITLSCGQGDHRGKHDQVFGGVAGYGHSLSCS